TRESTARTGAVVERKCVALPRPSRNLTSMTLKLPRLTGRALVAARLAVEASGTGAAIRQLVWRGLAIDQLATIPPASRGDLPMDARPLQARPPRRRDPGDLPLPYHDAWPRTSAAYATAYRNRAVSPLDIAEKALGELTRLAGRRPSMNI